MRDSHQHSQTCRMCQNLPAACRWWWGWPCGLGAPPAPSGTAGCVGTSWGSWEKREFLKEHSTHLHRLWEKKKGKTDSASFNNTSQKLIKHLTAHSEQVWCLHAAVADNHQPKSPASVFSFSVFNKCLVMTLALSTFITLRSRLQPIFLFWIHFMPFYCENLEWFPLYKSK